MSSLSNAVTASVDSARSPRVDRFAICSLPMARIWVVSKPANLEVLSAPICRLLSALTWLDCNAWSCVVRSAAIWIVVKAATSSDSIAAICSVLSA